MVAMRKAILWALLLTLTVLFVPISAAGSSVNLERSSPSPLSNAAPASSVAAPIPTATQPGGSSEVPIAGASSAISPSFGSSSGLALEKRILATTRADHLPLEAVSLPNLLGDATVSNGVVTPL